MRGLLALFLLACIVGVTVGQGCGELESCGQGECCAGSFYHRTCRALSEDGMPCQKRNNGNHYTVACPCKEGLICSPINRCQTPY